MQEPLPDGTGRLSTTYRTLRAYDRAEDILSFKALVYDQLDDGQRKFVDAIEGYSRRNDPAQWERAEPPSALRSRTLPRSPVRSRPSSRASRRRRPRRRREAALSLVYGKRIFECSST